MTSIAVIVFTDGRTGLLDQTLRSFFTNVQIPASWGERLFIFDDSADPKVHDHIRRNYPEFHLVPALERQGFAGTIHHAWHLLRFEYRFMENIDYVFHLEDDFVFNRQVRVAEMAHVLQSNGSLAQVALVRQPWNDVERAAGGLLQARPDTFTQRRTESGVAYLEHDAFFTTNPCLYPGVLPHMVQWPLGADSEGRFGITMRNAGAKFAFLGELDQEPAVTHIGAERNGTGY